MSGVALRDKRIWITGASSGIGRDLALRLAELGNIVAVSARNADALAELQAQYPDNIWPLPCDIGDKAQVAAAQAQLETHFSALDIVVLNAGTCEYVDVSQFESSLFERVHRTNFLGAVYCLEVALPLLRKGLDPYIVGVSSSVSYIGLPRAEAYGASKAALTHMLQALRAEVREEGIDVSVVSPGFVKTPLTDLNDFPMPFRISSEEAVQRIVQGMADRDYEIHFPKRFTYMLKFISILPTWLSLRICQRMVKH